MTKTYDLDKIPLRLISCMAYLHCHGTVSSAEVARLQDPSVSYPVLDDLEHEGLAHISPDGKYNLTPTGTDLMLILTAAECRGVM